MRRFLAYALTSLAALTADCVLDLGARAEAAYQTVGVPSAVRLDTAASAGMAISEEAPPAPNTEAPNPKSNHPFPWAHRRLAEGHTTGAGSPSGPSSGSTTTTLGLLAAIDLPSPRLVSRLLLAEGPLTLPRSPTSILDPPRLA